MKKLTFLLSAAFSASALLAASVDDVTCSQGWPWTTDITVSYTVSGVGDAETFDATFEAFNGSMPIALDTAGITGERYGLANGTYTLKINPKKAFGLSRAAYADFKVRVSLVAAPANRTEVLYKIFDLDTGDCADVSRADLLNDKYGAYETDYGNIGTGIIYPSTVAKYSTTLKDVLIWTGVTNDVAYKTSKLVMRKIDAKDKVWQSGDPAGASTPDDGRAYSKKAQFWDKLTYDYYIAVFELTLAQYKKIYGSTPSGCDVAEGDTEGLTAANQFPYDRVIGSPTATASTGKGQVTDEAIVYPDNTYVRDVAKNSIAGKLWDKTRAAGKCYEFTLPSLAEWEFACMGGNATAIYTGLSNSLDANSDPLGWNMYNTTHIHMVGERACNAYGLYDILGNVGEFVCGKGDLASGGESGTGASEDDPVVNPKGTTTSASPFNCGGCWSNACSGYGWRYSMRHAGRHSGWIGINEMRTYLGCRLVIPARADGQWADHPAK